MDDQNNLNQNNTNTDDDFASLNSLVEEHQQQQTRYSAGPEGMPVVETTKNPTEIVRNEKLTQAELAKTPVPQSRLEEEQSITLSDVATKPIQAKVVDKSEEPLHLHPINQTPDKLTEEADKEEEHFIEEVEKHHGHKP